MGTDRVSNLPKVILLISDRSGIWTQASQPGSTAHTVAFSAVLLPWQWVSENYHKMLWWDSPFLLWVLGCGYDRFLTLILDATDKIRSAEWFSWVKSIRLHVLSSPCSFGNCVIQKVFFKKEAAVTLEIQLLFSVLHCPLFCWPQAKKGRRHCYILYLYEPSSCLMLKCLPDPCQKCLLGASCGHPHLPRGDLK